MKNYSVFLFITMDDDEPTQFSTRWLGRCIFIQNSIFNSFVEIHDYVTISKVYSMKIQLLLNKSIGLPDAIHWIGIYILEWCKNNSWNKIQFYFGSSSIDTFDLKNKIWRNMMKSATNFFEHFQFFYNRTSVQRKKKEKRYQYRKSISFEWVDTWPHHRSSSSSDYYKLSQIFYKALFLKEKNQNFYLKYFKGEPFNSLLKISITITKSFVLQCHKWLQKFLGIFGRIMTNNKSSFGQTFM